jgi:hypothetical protein
VSHFLRSATQVLRVCPRFDGFARTRLESLQKRNEDKIEKELCLVMRTFLTVREAAFLLQRSEMAVRRMIDAGQLRSLGDWETESGRQRRRLSPESVRQHFPNDGSRELRRLALGAILAGRLRVPAPAGRWGAPVLLHDVVDLLNAHAFHLGIQSSSATVDRTFKTINHINHRVNFIYNDQ